MSQEFILFNCWKLKFKLNQAFILFLVSVREVLSN